MARRIDKEKCTNCGECEQVCPVSVINEEAGKRVIDEDGCIDCGACEGACDFGAISEV